MNILAIDSGTTGVTALVVSSTGEVLSRGYCEFEQHFPKPGWVEHDPEQIWQAVLISTKAAVANFSIQAIGITNQRETLVLWDRKTLKAPRNAIVWQDRRTSDIVDELRSHEPIIRSKTGTPLDPYFTSTKLVWLQRNEPTVWADVLNGMTLIGTVDSYLVARLSGGRHHITDASNASRTQLCNIDTGEWDDALLELFGVPKAALPKIVPNYGMLAETDPDEFLGIGAPITGVAGDQQAALFGQAAFGAGDTKCTYGTGAFLLTNTGKKRISSKSGLITTIAWKAPTGEITYALEGSVFVAGSAVQWLRDGLKLIEKSSDVEKLAASVPDSGGVTFVPALTGLGAPWWNSEVRGSITGITRGTTDAHIARATLEAVAFQVTDLVRALEQDLGQPIKLIRVDGGMSVNNLLMQIQANALGCTVERGKNVESTGIGAAYLAGLGAKLIQEQAALAEIWTLDQRFETTGDPEVSTKKWHTSVIDLLNDRNMNDVLALAKSTYNRAYDLVVDGTEETLPEGLELAAASLQLWRQVGNEQNWSIGLWLYSRALHRAGSQTLAIAAAKESLDLAKSVGTDWLIASALEGLTRASINTPQFADLLEKTQLAIDAIADDEDRALIYSQFKNLKD